MAIWPAASNDPDAAVIDEPILLLSLEMQSSADSETSSS